MTSEEQRSAQRVPVALRIKLRFREVDTFVSKFATNISSSGIFISSRKPRDVGTELRFELRLADNSEVVAGKGRVAWVRDYDPKHPKLPHGMGVEFLSLDAKSQELVDRIVERKVEQGLGNRPGIPFSPEHGEVDSLDEELDMSAIELEPDNEVSVVSAVAQPHVIARSATPVARAEISALDEQDVDVDAAIARARRLRGKGSVEAELAELARVAPPSVALDVDDASEQLARMVGGQPVRRSHVSREHDTPPPAEVAVLDSRPWGTPAAEAQNLDEYAPGSTVDVDEMDLESAIDSLDEEIETDLTVALPPAEEDKGLKAEVEGQSLDLSEGDEDGLGAPADMVINLDDEDDLDAEIYTDPDSIAAIPHSIEVDGLDAGGLDLRPPEQRDEN